MVLPMERVFECMREQQDREDREQFWRSYMASIVPMWGGKDTPTYEALLERYERRRHVTTREEIEAAEEVGREVAARFGML